MNLDLILQNGTILDGTGRAAATKSKGAAG